MATKFSDLVIQLSGGINQHRLYGAGHARVRDKSGEFLDNLRARFEERNETGFFFGILNGKFIRQGKYLIGPSIAGRNIIDFAGKLGCGGFRFLQDVSVEELDRFFTIATELRNPTASLAESQELFQSRGLVNIELTPHYRESLGEDEGEVDLATIDPGLIQFEFSDLDDLKDGSDEGPAKSLSNDLAPLLPIFQSMYDTVAANNIHVSGDQDVDVAQALTVSEDLNEVSDRQTMDVMNLMRYPDYDSYTVGHSVRVATLALTVGKQMGWPEHLLPELATAGLLHDVGKAKVPDEILYKPGQLTPEELKIAHSHAALGAQILIQKGDASPLVIAGAWGHHIRYDGGGYPDAPDWVRRSSVAALLQVCDVFEALTAARPYKSPLPPRRAFEIIMKDAGAFHPDAVRALIHAIGLYPLGSKVNLTNGCRGFVTKRGDGWGHPTVRVVWNRQGQKLDPDDQYYLDLQDEPGVAVDDFTQVGLEAEAPDPLITHHI